MRRQLRVWLSVAGLAVLGVVLLAAAACGDDSGNGGDNGNADGGNGGSGGGEQVAVTGRDNFFEPEEISIPAGEEVTVVFTNEGAAIHNLRIESADAAGQDFTSEDMVNPGDSSEFTVQIDEAGTYTFVCDYHPEMTGTLTVE